MIEWQLIEISLLFYSLTDLLINLLTAIMAIHANNEITAKVIPNVIKNGVKKGVGVASPALLSTMIRAVIITEQINITTSNAIYRSVLNEDSCFFRAE